MYGCSGPGPLLDYPAVATQAIGDMVPNLQLPAVDGGEPVSIDARLAERGRQGAVVVFWSSVCTHCVRYDAYFNRFEAAPPELALYVVATRWSETAEDIRRAVHDRQLRS